MVCWEWNGFVMCLEWVREFEEDEIWKVFMEDEWFMKDMWTIEVWLWKVFMKDGECWNVNLEYGFEMGLWKICEFEMGLWKICVFEKWFENMKYGNVWMTWFHNMEDVWILEMWIWNIEMFWWLDFRTWKMYEFWKWVVNRKYEERRCGNDLWENGERWVNLEYDFMNVMKYGRCGNVKCD